MTKLAPLIEQKSKSAPVLCDVEALRLRLGYDTVTMRKSGYDPANIEAHEIFNGSLEVFFEHPVIGEYLKHLTPRESYMASGVMVLSLRGIKDNIQDLVPGALILAHGYLVVATDVGGNAICFHAPSGRVVWIENTMSEDSITYKDRTTDDYRSVPFTPENLEEAVAPLSDTIEEFMTDLLNERLQDQLDALDS